MMRGAAGAACVVLLLAVGALAAETNAVPPSGVFDNDAVWEGTVRVDRTLTVAGNAVLTVRPGTVVAFAKGAALIVGGRMVAEGTAGAPIRFVSGERDPGRGAWAGIRLHGSAPGTALSRCVVSHAASVSIESCAPQVRDCEIAEGTSGVVFGSRSGGVFERNVVRGMTEGGIRCERGASPLVAGNTVRECGPVGIGVSQDAAPRIRDNIVSGCDYGVSVFGDGPPVEGNRCEKNKVGIAVTQAGPARLIRGNRAEGNGTGISCWQFASPVVERNELTGNGEGLACVRMSNPLVRNNEIAKNRRGISCDRISRPRVVGNDVHGNDTGIYLTFSSYALVNGNNLYENRVQLELGNMSAQWEERVGKKPERGLMARTATRMGRGMAGRAEVARTREDGAVIMGAVDATGNWWGEKDTGEMERKGPDADIASLVDGHDVPTRSYEGYPGEFAQDRIKYEGWKKTRIEGAGIRGKGEDGSK